MEQRLKPLLSFGSVITWIGGAAAAGGIIWLILGGPSGAAGLVGAGVVLAYAGASQRSRIRQMIRDKAAGKEVVSFTTSRRDPAGQWKVLALANTMMGILVSVFAIVLMPPPWAVVVVVFMVVGVWETWRFERRVSARRASASKN
jgi:hypothetical protein